MCPAAPPGGWWLCRVDPAGSAGGDHQGRLTGWAPHTHGLGREGAGVGGGGGRVPSWEWFSNPYASIRSTPKPSRWGGEGARHPQGLSRSSAPPPRWARLETEAQGRRGSCLLRVAGSRQDKAAGRIQTAQWERPHSQLRRKRCLKAGGGERVMA